MPVGPEKYGDEYFAPYGVKGRLLKLERGERWYLYAYWRRYILSRYPRGSRILEIGCGLGYFAMTVPREFEYVGTDISLFPLRVAFQKTQDTLAFVQANVLHLALRSESFDLVVAFDVLEHVPTPSGAISEIYRVLRKNGRLIMTVPNVKSLGNRMKDHSPGLAPSMYLDKTHVSLLDPQEWTGIIRNSGFKTLRSLSDTLWDIPYTKKIPVAFQKIILIPFNILTSYFLGGLPWSLGENLVFVCEK
jgi:SAM-dependent methyltransferase